MAPAVVALVLVGATGVGLARDDDPLTAPTPAALPAGASVPSLVDLQGRWLQGGDPRRWLEIRDTAWAQGVGGCNTWAREFRLTPAGGFRFTGTESVTEMGCAGEDPGWAVVQVARVELDASVLLLLDADGVELARLSRSGESD